MTTTIATVRQSPFRETEWDRRLDNMLEDLENSAATTSNGVASCTSSTNMQQQQMSMSSNVSHQMVSHSASQSSSAIQQQRSTSSNRQLSSSNNSGAIAAASDSSSSQHNGYGSVLQKSKSGSQIQENTDSLLKEMDNALKASSNFIETHRSSSTAGPNSKSTSEYHEYRSYSNGGSNRGGGGGGEFNLERQVQHMMPPPSPSLSGLMERSNQQ